MRIRIRPVSQTVKTSPSHGEDRSSILLLVTMQSHRHQAAISRAMSDVYVMQLFVRLFCRGVSPRVFPLAQIGAALSQPVLTASFLDKVDFAEPLLFG